MNDRIFDVSVVIATYNPIWEKCVFTIDSVIKQRGISLELIIVDDGSIDNLFSSIAKYLDSKSFHSYRLVAHDYNQGTVKNYYDGVKVASGKYIKLISPGDALFSDFALAEWIAFTGKNGRKWSFGNAVFYKSDGNHKQIVQVPDYPRLIECYHTKNDIKCRWNYVVLEDYAIGAAILCERMLLAEYLGRIIDNVKYSEDLAHALMMFDGILPAYYDQNVIFYEYGTGTSTGEDRWKALIRVDMKNVELIMINDSNSDAFQRKMIHALQKMNSRGELFKKVIKYLQRGGIRKYLKYRLNPRLSSNSCSSYGTWWI